MPGRSTKPIRRPSGRRSLGTSALLTVRRSTNASHQSPLSWVRRPPPGRRGPQCVRAPHPTIGRNQSRRAAPPNRAGTDLRPHRLHRKDRRSDRTDDVRSAARWPRPSVDIMHEAGGAASVCDPPARSAEPSGRTVIVRVGRRRACAGAEQGDPPLGSWAHTLETRATAGSERGSSGAEEDRPRAVGKPVGSDCRMVEAGNLAQWYAATARSSGGVVRRNCQILWERVRRDCQIGSGWVEGFT